MNLRSLHQLQEYERLMGRRAAERQERLAEEMGRCTCGLKGSFHLPECNRSKAKLLRGAR